MNSAVPRVDDLKQRYEENRRWAEPWREKIAVSFNNGDYDIPYLDIRPEHQTRPTIYYFNGFHATPYFLVEQYRILQERGYRICVPSVGLLGSASCDQPPATIQQHVLLADAIYDALNERSPENAFGNVLMGHSMGGTAALLLGQSRKLPTVLLNPILPEISFADMAWRSVSLQGQDSSGSAQGDPVAPAFISGAALPYMMRLIKHPLSSLRMVRSFGAVTYGELAMFGDGVPTPVLLLWGDQDAFAKIDGHESSLRQHLPAIQIESLAGEPHNWPLMGKRSEETVRSIDAFVDRYVGKANAF